MTRFVRGAGVTVLVFFACLVAYFFAYDHRPLKPYAMARDFPVNTKWMPVPLVCENEPRKLLRGCVIYHFYEVGTGTLAAEPDRLEKRMTWTDGGD